MIGASTAVSAVGAVRQGQAAKASGRFNAQVGEQNARFMEENARDATRRGMRETEKVYAQGAQVIGTQRAALAARGLDANFGSPLDFILASAAAIELDAEATRENTRRVVQDFERDAWNARTGAAMSRASGDNAATAARFNAIGSVLDGGAGIYRYKTTGAV